MAGCVESDLLPTVSIYVLATVALRNSWLKWNPLRYPEGYFILSESLVKRSSPLRDVRNLPVLNIISLNTLFTL